MYAHELYEQSKPQVIVTYPGRFQPFHQGHAEVFSQLQKKFGRDSVYILTSNDTSSAKSPFSFSDKYQLMTAAGIPGDRIIETNQMYKLPANVDAANTIFITAVGAPDADRLNPDTFTKRDQKDKDGNVTKPAGSPSYYKIWNDKVQPVTADQHGYVIVIPEIHKEITIKGRKYDVSHGTECRNLWNTFRNDPKARKEFLSQMYTRPSQELGLIFDKIPQTTSEDVRTDSQTSTSPIHGADLKQGVAEGSQRTQFTAEELDAINQYLDDDLGFQELRTYPGLIRKIASHFDIASIQGHSGEMNFYDRLVQARAEGHIPEQGVAEGNNQSSAKTGIYQSEVYGTKAYHSKCLEKGCDWESRRYDRIKQAQDAAKKHAQTHIKPGMAEDAAGVGVVAKNKKMARDPRYSMSITKDVKPSTPKNMLRAFRLSENSDVSPETVMGMVKKFLPLAMKELKLSTLPKIVLKKHLVAHDGQATFGRFANEEQKIYLGIADRHPVDILRTLAHELVHYKQHAQGKLGPDSGETGSPIENQANAVAAVIMRHFNKKYPDAIHSNAISLEESLAKKYKTFLENDEPDEVRQKKNLIPFPKGTVKVDVSDVYDWYKIGQTISDLDDADPKDFGKGPPQTVLSFGSEPQEHKYLKDLKRLGLKTHDIDETYNGPKMKFLRPGELRGSYTDKQLRDMGFKRSEQGVWYIPYEQWKQLVASKTISENPDIVNEKKKRKKRKTNLKGRPFYGYYYGLGTAADSGAGSGDGGGGGIAEGGMDELDMDLEDPEMTDRQFEKIYGMTRKEARELFSRTNMWDFPDFRDPSKPLHEQGVAEGNNIKISLKVNQDSTVDVKAMLDGEEVGHVHFDDSEGELIPQDLYVDPKYRGQGIAAAMYNYTKRKGYTILRGEEQSDDAVGFWAKHRPGKKVWEQGVAESLNSPYSYHWEEGDFGDLNAYAQLSDNTVLDIEFEQISVDKSQWTVGFQRDGQIHKTGKGDEQRVFATVLSAIKEFIENKQPKEVFFSAEKSEVNPESRKRLYDRLVQKYATALGYQASQSETNWGTKYKFSRIREQGVAEGMAQDESEQSHGWVADSIDEINYNTFEVHLTNTRSGESADLVIRPVDMMRISGKLQIETIDVRDLSTGDTQSWTTEMPDPQGAIVDAIDALFWDNPKLNKKLYAIVDAHSKKGQDMLPGQKNRAKVGMATPADQFIAGQDAIAKAKGAVKEFDAQGFQQRYTLYKDGYEIEKFGDMDDAIEYAEDDRRDGDDPSAVYKIVDINKQVVWDGDPYEKPSRIQLRKPEQGVAEENLKEFAPGPDFRDDDDRQDMPLLEFAEIIKLFLGSEYTMIDRKTSEQVSVKFDPKDRTSGHNGAVLYSIIGKKQNEYPTVNFQLIDYEQGPQVGRGRRAGTAIPKTRTNALKIADIIYNTMGLPQQDRRVEENFPDGKHTAGNYRLQEAGPLKIAGQVAAAHSSANDVVSRFQRGDYAGAGIGALSAIANLKPGLGTAVSLGLDYINDQRDKQNSVANLNKPEVQSGIANDEIKPINPDAAMQENFADGRNPGRKGLAKRMGVPTKASVTRLRQIAKSSSGEKQRMAHWMANMKAGKAKK